MVKIKEFIVKQSEFRLPEKGILKALITVFCLLSVSGCTSPAGTALYNIPVTDPSELRGIETALAGHSIALKVSKDDRLYVTDEETAFKARAVLIKENMTPSMVSASTLMNHPAEVSGDNTFEIELLKKNLRQHIESLNEIHEAEILLFPSEERSVVIKILSSENIDEKTVRGIESMTELAFQITREDITLLDSANNQVLNSYDNTVNSESHSSGDVNFPGEKDSATHYKKEILKVLETVFTSERVSVMDVSASLAEDSARDAERYPWKKENVYVALIIEKKDERPLKTEEGEPESSFHINNASVTAQGGRD